MKNHDLFLFNLYSNMILRSEIEEINSTLEEFDLMLREYETEKKG